MKVFKYTLVNEKRHHLLIYTIFPELRFKIFAVLTVVGTEVSTVLRDQGVPVSKGL